jgi:NADPH-dependent glutamate synthase beta subunit-like oxidoreductase
LSPFLDGSRTVAELTRSLPAERRDMVERVIDELHQNGCLTDVARDDPQTLSGAVRDAYPAQISLVERNQGAAGREFHRYRQSHVLVVGSGTTLTAAVGAVLRTGVERVAAFRHRRVPDRPDPVGRGRPCRRGT